MGVIPKPATAPWAERTEEVCRKYTRDHWLVGGVSRGRSTSSSTISPVPQILMGSLEVKDAVCAEPAHCTKSLFAFASSACERHLAGKRKAFCKMVPGNGAGAMRSKRTDVGNGIVKPWMRRTWLKVSVRVLRAFGARSAGTTVNGRCHRSRNPPNCASLVPRRLPSALRRTSTSHFRSLSSVVGKLTFAATTASVSAGRSSADCSASRRPVSSSFPSMKMTICCTCCQPAPLPTRHVPEASVTEGRGPPGALPGTESTASPRSPVAARPALGLMTHCHDAWCQYRDRRPPTWAKTGASPALEFLVYLPAKPAEAFFTLTLTGWIPPLQEIRGLSKR
mmetsp:Transcript_65594/g.203214  ORF Transcript_65594/g.203214 Transcript_65594/m.203214 type:complete len:337 (-) Transcript_65594:289-1299(-)